MVPYHIDFNLFDTHEERNHNGILWLNLYAHHAILRADCVCEIPINKEDHSLGWRDAVRYQVDAFLRKDVCNLSMSNSPEDEYWYIAIEINGVQLPVTFIFQTLTEADEIFNKILNWWLHGEIV